MADHPFHTVQDVESLPTATPHRALLIPEIVERIFYFVCREKRSCYVPRRIRRRRHPRRSSILSFICVNKFWASLAISILWRRPLKGYVSLNIMFRRLENPEDSERGRFYASLVVEGLINAWKIPPYLEPVNLRAPLESFLSRLEFPRMKVLTVELEPRCWLFKMQGQNVTVLKLYAARRMSPGSYFRFLDKEQMDAIIDQVCIIFPNVETLIIRGVCEISSATIAKIKEKLLKLEEFQYDEKNVTVVD